MNIKTSFFCLFWFLILAIPQDILAKIVLEAPKQVARGDAFLAKAVSDTPEEQFIFFWRGGKHTVKAEIKKDEDGNPCWEGLVLLPAPLDEKSGQLKLGAGAGKDKALASVSANIKLFDRKRPVQKLTVDKKYVNPPASELARIQKDREKVAAALATSNADRSWELPFQRPVPGTISSSFGMKRVFNGQPRSVHRGLDMRGAQGSPILACADGRVALVDNLYYSGNTVYIDHGNGVFTAYLHMSEPKVSVGQQVRRGDLVGLVGATGRVTGPHLHLSLVVQGQSSDPEPLLESASGSGNEKK